VDNEGTVAPVPPENKDDKLNRSDKIRFPNEVANILLQFRDGHATDMQSLFEALFPSMPPTPHRGIGKSTATIKYDVRRIVEQLIDAQLLQVDDPADRELKHTKIEVTNLLWKVLAVFDLSLTSLATIDRPRSLIVQPMFGVPDAIDSNLDVFVLMPFRDEILPVYQDHIKRACAKLNLTVRRADDFFTAHSVVWDIWEGIVSARSIVADCTGRNPNVFYEIGLAHTLGKPTILLTQREEDIPFDLRHLRYIPYQLTPRGMKEFEAKFEETVRNVLSSAE
jgi:hypothetical protein